MLRRNPTRIESTPDEAEMREALIKARKAREIELGLLKPEEAAAAEVQAAKLTTAQRIGFAKKPSS